MASDDLQQLLARREAVSLKLSEVMRLVMLAADEMLASGEIPPGDPEFAALAPRAEAIGLATHVGAAGSVATYERRAEEYTAAGPGGEAVAEAMRRQAASEAKLAEQAGEYAAFMRRVGAPAAVESASSEMAAATKRSATVRPRRPNAKYFGPEWTN